MKEIIHGLKSFSFRFDMVLSTKGQQSILCQFIWEANTVAWLIFKCLQSVQKKKVSEECEKLKKKL